MTVQSAAYVVGTETSQTPDCSSFMMVGYSDLPKVAPDEEITPENYTVKNGGHTSQRRPNGTQANPRGVAYVVATETSQTPDCSSFLMMSYVDDQKTNGDETVSGNARGNRLSNYIPRIAGG